MQSVPPRGPGGAAAGVCPEQLLFSSPKLRDGTGRDVRPLQLQPGATAVEVTALPGGGLEGV
eukprot:5338006-Pyramimonas_sp.AAC.1